MEEKQRLIARILELQKQFTAYEETHGLAPSEYFDPPAGHEFEKYRAEHTELAERLAALAHEEKGSTP